MIYLGGFRMGHRDSDLLRRSVIDAHDKEVGGDLLV